MIYLPVDAIDCEKYLRNNIFGILYVNAITRRVLNAKRLKFRDRKNSPTRP